MRIIDRLKEVLGTRAQESPDESGTSFSIDFDGAGVNLRMDLAEFKALNTGDGRGSSLIQFTALQLLEEQGAAGRLPNGFEIASRDVVRLDGETAEILGLPPRYPGALTTVVTGDTTSSRFTVTPVFDIDGIREPVDRTGPTVSYGGSDYLLSPPALAALEAIDQHSNSPSVTDREHHNVELVARIQQAQDLAESPEPEIRDDRFAPDLRQLEHFTTVAPAKVAVTVEQRADGSLLLSPDVGADARAEDFAAREHQVEEGNVIRIDRQLVLLTERQRKAVKRIIERRRVEPSAREDFYRSPGEHFSDDDGVMDDIDLELSFSVRVEGIGALVPVTFTDAAESGIDWLTSLQSLQTPEALAESLTTLDELADVKERIAESWDASEGTITYGEQIVDVSDAPRTENALTASEARISAAEIAPPDVLPETSGPEVTVGMFIAESSSQPERLRQLSELASSNHVPDLSRLHFTPYSHQEEGIRWAAGMLSASLAGRGTSPRIQGALLADDMGLGKTFMALAALRDFNQQQVITSGQAKPSLVVLPLALIENWEAEARSAFVDPPFDDVVVLQRHRDLPSFQVSGRKRETVARASSLDESGMMRETDLRLSLRVGDWFREHRLDQPNRLVLTTYQVLASYQLSLGQVEWGAVVFDEAQQLKNPETLVSRAAKGLKAHFKLLATGTPVENSLKDLWNLMDTAQPDLLGSWSDFRRNWVSPEGTAEDQAERGRALRDEIGQFMLRRTKEDTLHGLPTKTVHTGIPDPQQPGSQYDERLALHMPPRQRETYDRALASHSPGKGSALKTLQRIKDVSLHPLTLDRDASDCNDSARVSALLGVLDAVAAAGEKVIIFVINTKVQIYLAQWLNERYGFTPRIVNGQTRAVADNCRDSTETRRTIIDDFQAADGFNMIIMSPLAVGVGLTVVGANHAIHLERHWNPAKEAQATDRIHRIGQTRNVHVYLPLAVHPDVTSFDINLDTLLQSKMDLKDAVVVPGNIERQLAEKMGLSASAPDS